MNRDPNILTQSCCTQMQLLAYLSKELNVQEFAKVEHHFTNCALCSDAIDGLFFLSMEERKALMDNKNPFAKEDEKLLKIGFKKNNVLQIAAVLFLLVGVGFGMYQFSNRNEQHSIAKSNIPSINNKETSNETNSETTIANAEKIEAVKNNVSENFAPIKVPSIAKSDAGYCPPELKKVVPAKIVAKVEASKYEDFEKTIDNNVASTKSDVSQNVESNVIEKTEYKLARSNEEASKIKDQVVKKVASQKVLPAPVSTNMSNNYLNKETSNGGGIYTDDVATNAIGTTKVLENTTVSKDSKKKTTSKAKADNNIVNQGTNDMDSKLASAETLNKNALDAIENRFNNKNYANAIALGEAFLKSKAGENNSKAMYYLGLCYIKINNTKKAKEMMKKVANGSSEFAKSAKKILEGWTEEN